MSMHCGPTTETWGIGNSDARVHLEELKAHELQTERIMAFSTSEPDARGQPASKRTIKNRANHQEPGDLDRHRETSIVTEYAWPTAMKCDPCPPGATRLSSKNIRELGGKLLGSRTE